MTAGSEKGSALLLVLMAASLLVSLGSALVLLAVSETAISASFVRGAQVLGDADAALELAAVELDALPDWSAALAGLTASGLVDGIAGGTRQVGDVIVNLTAATTMLNAVGASRPFGRNNPRWQLFVWGGLDRLNAEAARPGYVAVWIADDPSEGDDDPRRDGGSADQAGRDVVLVAAQAFGAGGARRMLEAVVIRPAGRTAIVSRREVR